MTCPNRDEFYRLDPKLMYIDNGDSVFESSHINWHECRSKIEELCGDRKTKRCQSLQNDSDDAFFGYQCNLGKDHDGDCAFGLDSMLWYLSDRNEPQCTDEEHVGTCSVCLVRSVRERDY